VALSNVHRVLKAAQTFADVRRHAVFECRKLPHKQEAASGLVDCSWLMSLIGALILLSCH